MENTNPELQKIYMMEILREAALGGWTAACFEGSPPLEEKYRTEATSRLINIGCIERVEQEPGHTYRLTLQGRDFWHTIPEDIKGPDDRINWELVKDLEFPEC